MEKPASACSKQYFVHQNNMKLNGTCTVRVCKNDPTRRFGKPKRRLFLTEDQSSTTLTKLRKKFPELRKSLPKLQNSGVPICETSEFRRRQTGIPEYSNWHARSPYVRIIYVYRRKYIARMYLRTFICTCFTALMQPYHLGG